MESSNTFSIMMNIREIKRSARALTLKELAVLDVWLHNLIGVKEAKMRVLQAKKQLEAPRLRPSPRKTYRLQVVRCGKQTCKCREGELHGPYWYAYWIENGKMKSQYIGKKLPKSVKLRHSKSDALIKI